jgi:hypothetical protein
VYALFLDNERLLSVTRKSNPADDAVFALSLTAPAEGWTQLFTGSGPAAFDGKNLYVAVNTAKTAGALYLVSLDGTGGTDSGFPGDKREIRLVVMGGDSVFVLSKTVPPDAVSYHVMAAKVGTNTWKKIGADTVDTAFSMYSDGTDVYLLTSKSGGVGVDCRTAPASGGAFKDCGGLNFPGDALEADLAGCGSAVFGLFKCGSAQSPEYRAFSTVLSAGLWVQVGGALPGPVAAGVSMSQSAPGMACFEGFAGGSLLYVGGAGKSGAAVDVYVTEVKGAFETVGTGLPAAEGAISSGVVAFISDAGSLYSAYVSRMGAGGELQMYRLEP